MNIELKNFKYNLSVNATSQAEADAKVEALAKLAGQFDAKTLKALAAKGPAFLTHPTYGGIVRKNLGL